MKVRKIEWPKLEGFKLKGGTSFVRQRPGLVLYLLMTLFVAALCLNQTTGFEVFESRVLDLMFRIRGASNPSGEVVILGIDDKSLKSLGEWPWGHQRLAQMFEALTYYRPKCVLYQPAIEDRIDDYQSGMSQLLAENILQSGNIVLSFPTVLAERTPATGTAPRWMRKSSLATILPFEAEDIPRASRIDLPDSIFGKAAALAGASMTLFDPDRSVRKQPLIMRFERGCYPSAELAAASMALDLSLDALQFDEDDLILSLSDRQIPVDYECNYLIDYYGGSGRFPYYSVKDFWDGELQIDKLKGRTVVIALTAPSLADKLPMSFDDGLSPAEKSATIVDNIITDRFISPMNAQTDTEIAIILVIGVLCALIVPRVPLVYRYVTLVAAAFAVVAFGFVMFTSFHTHARIVYPSIEVLLFALVAPLASTARSLTKSSQKAGEPAATATAEQHTTKAKAEAMHTQDELRKQSTEVPAETSHSETDMVPENPTGQFEHSPRLFETEEQQAAQDALAALKEYKHPSSTDKTPLAFGRYQVIETLGRGAMGTVYKGKDPAIDRLVALKTIRLDKIADASEIDELRERLTREAKAAGNLSHPNIVTIYDVGQDGDVQYIAMEYLEGYTLEQIIARKLELNFRIAANIVLQVCSALSYAHRHNIVHRDIKPANIMVLDGFHIKVMDFGIAHFESSSLTKTGIAMGTPNYISPEQLRGEEVTKSSDIFSLGVVFYEILTGKKPFTGDNISNIIMKILEEDPPVPSTYSEKIPPMFDIIVKKALKKNPYDRYHSADEMSRALEDIVGAFAPKKATY